MSPATAGIFYWFFYKGFVNVFAVMTYMPQDFRGTLIRQQRDRSERNKQAEVDALVNSGASIRDRYALLWKQQMERWGPVMIFFFLGGQFCKGSEWPYDVIVFPPQEETVSSTWFGHRCLQNPCEVLGWSSTGCVFLAFSPNWSHLFDQICLVVN